MFHSRRPSGRFFYWLSIGMFLLTMNLCSVAVTARTTRVSDTVFRADGTPARGTILISWPAFTDANGAAVAAGRTTVTIAANGAIDFPLVANTGSTPASYYTVVLKLDDGATATEYWTVPSAISTTVAAIRSKMVPTSVATQFVGRDYVDSAVYSANADLIASVAAKASDNAVVHYASNETITGVKTFNASPVVPTPSAATHAANKGYVDSAVSNVSSSGSGINGVRQADRFPSLQGAIDDAGTSGSVVIPPGYTGQDNFSNPNARSILDLRRIGDARGGDISVKDFGARGDGGWYSQVSCTNGSSVIGDAYYTNITNANVAPKVGQTLVVSGCGPGGADLQCTISAVGAPGSTITCGGGVKAAATLNVRGARWGYSVDDTPAFQAAVNYCASSGSAGGCNIRVPPGTYFVSNVTFPAFAAGRSGQVMLRGVGRNASSIIGIGAARTAIFRAPDNSVPTYIADLGFQSFDFNNRSQIAVQWLGGQEHTFTNNYVTNMYEMVNASNTWINLISNNRCYAVEGSCIEFGTGLGNDTVNATRVVFNELANWGDHGDITRHAYHVHSGSASYENTFAFNSIEDSNPPFGEPVDANDNQSQFIFEYQETADPPSGFFGIFRGNAQQLHFAGINCISIPGTSANVFGLAGSTCAGQTYAIKNDGIGLTTFGIPPEKLSSPATATAYGNINMSVGPIRTYAYQPGTPNDWANGRMDIGGVAYGFADATTTNPSVPNSFGTSAVIPLNARLANKWPSIGYPWGFAFHVCVNNPSGCTANPITPSQWAHFGSIETRVRTEGTSYAPNGQAWQPGDWFWNTNPSPASPILGWLTVTGGTPGTGRAAWAIDPNVPPAWGATTPNTIKGTTINATSGLQVNGISLVSSCGNTNACANTALTSGRLISGSVALSSGSATVTGIAPAFTSSSTFICTCSDRATTPAACSVQNASSSSITLKGTGTDTINYVCVGN